MRIPTDFPRAPSSRAPSPKKEHWGAALILVGIFEAPILIFHGFVLKVLWNWFVPSVFASLPRLGIGAAVGLTLVAGFVLPSEPTDENKSVFENVLTAFFTNIARGLTYLAIGFLVHAVIA